MSWGAYVQNGNMEEVESLGCELSLALHCAVHYPAFNKPLFECECGVVFPIYVVKTRNWNNIINKHVEEGKLIRQ